MSLARVCMPQGSGSGSRQSTGTRVVIIGAGPGGLAAALLLARAGVQVDVVERLPRVGGRCSSIEIAGFRFDLGPPSFYIPAC